MTLQFLSVILVACRTCSSTLFSLMQGGRAGLRSFEALFQIFVGALPPFIASVSGPGKLFGVTPTVFSHRRTFWVWTLGAPNVWSPGLMRSGSILQLV